MDKMYRSTRNKELVLSAKEAILKGIADDGGLFVYDELDQISLPLKDMMDMTYEQMAEVVLTLLLPDFKEEEIKQCVKAAYEKQFDDEHITPLYSYQDTHILELFHGPTCAFKDIGLRMLPQLMSTALKRHDEEKIMILTATSGDTGKAALAGFCDVERIGITVFYPKEGVSSIQQLQMTTQEGKNTCVCALEGNFDDAQSSVKKILHDASFAQELKQSKISFSSANSINIGRLIPQIVYYIYAYKELVRQGKIKLMEEVNFCVPTGNFGNVLAGYYAKLMGLPIHKLIVASNANHVLYDFLTSGVYDRNRPFHKTISPSMDILISSNLERLLYYKSGKNAAYIQMLMERLETRGSYRIEDELLKDIQNDFVGGYCDDEQCAREIKAFYEQSGYVMDPHTATGYKVMREYARQDKEHVCVLLSTASPYKFAPSVYQALFKTCNMDEFACMEELERKSGAAIPQALRELKEKAVRHHDVIEKDAMREYVKNKTKEILL